MIEKLNVPLEGSQALHIKMNEVIDFCNSLSQRHYIIQIGDKFGCDLCKDGSMNINDILSKPCLPQTESPQGEWKCPDCPHLPQEKPDDLLEELSELGSSATRNYIAYEGQDSTGKGQDSTGIRNRFEIEKKAIITRIRQHLK